MCPVELYYSIQFNIPNGSLLQLYNALPTLEVVNLHRNHQNARVKTALKFNQVWVESDSRNLEARGARVILLMKSHSTYIMAVCGNFTTLYLI